MGSDQNQTSGKVTMLVCMVCLYVCVEVLMGGFIRNVYVTCIHTAGIVVLY